MVRVTKWLSQRKKVEVGLDELKNLRSRGRPEAEDQLHSVSSLPWRSASIHHSFISVTVSFWALAKFSNLVLILLLSWPSFLKSPWTNQTRPSFRPTDLTIFPRLFAWVQLSKHWFRVLSSCPTYLKWVQALQIEDWKKHNSTWPFYLYFGVFKYEKVSVLKFHLWNSNYENYFLPF